MADSITEFGILSHVFGLTCSNLDGGFVDGFFIMINFWPSFVAFILVGIVLEHTEIFYSAFAWAFWGEWLINWGIRLAVNVPGPQFGCEPSVQVPALATDLLTFATLFLMIMSAYAFDFPIRWYKMLMITIFAPIAIYSRVFLKFNTPGQLLWGVLAGLVMSILWSLLIYYVLRRWRTSILYKTFLGTDYIDTLINMHSPILATNNYPLEVKMKIKDHQIQQELIDDYLLKSQVSAFQVSDQFKEPSTRDADEQILSIGQIEYIRPKTSFSFINEFVSVY